MKKYVDCAILSVATLLKLDKQIQLSKGIKVLYKDVHVVFVGFFFQILPVKGVALLQFSLGQLAKPYF